MAESFATGSAILDAMQAPFDDGHFLAPTEPGFGTALTEEMVLDHRPPAVSSNTASGREVAFAASE